MRKSGQKRSGCSDRCNRTFNFTFVYVNGLRDFLQHPARTTSWVCASFLDPCLLYDPMIAKNRMDGAYRVLMFSDKALRARSDDGAYKVVSARFDTRSLAEWRLGNNINDLKKSIPYAKTVLHLQVCYNTTKKQYYFSKAELSSAFLRRRGFEWTKKTEERSERSQGFLF